MKNTANAECKGEREAPYGWGWRHIVVVVAAIGNLLGYFLRVDMSVAIVDMVDQGEREAKMSVPKIVEGFLRTLKHITYSIWRV